MGRATCIASGLCAAVACVPAPSTSASLGAAPVVSTIADLRRLDPARSQQAVVLGALVRGDGGGGTFYWDATAAGAEDYLDVASATGRVSPGRWKRLLDASGTFQLMWFGARCDGRTYDDRAFESALAATSAVGGTLVLPPGRTCVVRGLNLGEILERAGGADIWPQPGVTLRGAIMGSAVPLRRSRELEPAHATTRQSTIYVNPETSPGAGCSALHDNHSASANGAIMIGPGSAFITFENIRIEAGPNLDSCLINISHTLDSVPPWDPSHVRFSGVTVVGNGKTTSSGIFLSNTGYVTFDECSFAGARNDILGDPGGYLHNTRILHGMFYPLNTSLCTAPAISLADAEALDLSDNAFEYGLAGIEVGGMRGGTVRSNWFNGEGVDPKDAHAAWLKISCSGCVIEGNRIIGGGPSGSGVDGIVVTGNSALIAGNSVVGAVKGVPLSVDGSNMSVLNNFFEGQTGPSNADLVVSGSGHLVAGNMHGHAPGYSLRLMRGSRGLLGYDPGTDSTVRKIDDSSSNDRAQPSAWTKLVR